MVCIVVLKGSNMCLSMVSALGVGKPSKQKQQFQRPKRAQLNLYRDRSDAEAEVAAGTKACWPEYKIHLVFRAWGRGTSSLLQVDAELSRDQKKTRFALPSQYFFFFFFKFGTLKNTKILQRNLDLEAPLKTELAFLNDNHPLEERSLQPSCSLH